MGRVFENSNANWFMLGRAFLYQTVHFCVEPGFLCWTMHFAVRLSFFVSNECYNFEWILGMQVTHLGSNRHFSFLLLINFMYNIFTFYYTPVWKTDRRIMPWQCPSIFPSVRPSVRVFLTFFQHALRYHFQSYYIHLVGGTTCRVSVSS